MKKLLQINSVVNSGSTGRVAEEIGQTAMTAGWESYIDYARNERPSQSELIKIGSDWNIRVRVTNFARTKIKHKSLLLSRYEKIKNGLANFFVSKKFASPEPRLEGTENREY